MGIIGRNIIGTDGNLNPSNFVIFLMILDATPIVNDSVLGNGYVYCRSSQSTGGTNEMRMYVYEIGVDDASSPLIATSALRTVPGSEDSFAWREFIFPDVTLTAGKTYAAAVIVKRGSSNAVNIVKTNSIGSHRTYNAVDFAAPVTLTGFSSVANSQRASMYVEYDDTPAPAREGFAALYEFIGSNTPENSTGALATNINFGNTDAVDLTPANYPIAVGGNSFFKQFIIDFSGSYTAISNMKIYKTSGNYVEGESIQFSGSVDASTPSTVNQNDPTIPASLPHTNNVTPYGGTPDDTIFVRTGTIGKTSIGETENIPTIEGKLFANWGHSVVVPFDATACTAYVYSALYSAGSSNYKISIYEKGDTEATTILQGSAVGTVNSTSPQWWNTPLNISLEANKEYLVTLQLSGSTGTLLGWADTGDARDMDNTNFIAPSTLSGAESYPVEFSFYIEYEGVSTNKTSLMRFQLLTTGNTPIISGNQKTISFTYDKQ